MINDKYDDGDDVIDDDKFYEFYDGNDDDNVLFRQLLFA